MHSEFYLKNLQRSINCFIEQIFEGYSQAVVNLLSNLQKN
jgi:hypothetical protein